MTREADTERPSQRYDEAMKELEQILEDVEDVSIPIDELAPKIERAAALIVTCRTVLERTETRVRDALDLLNAGDGSS